MFGDFLLRPNARRYPGEFLLKLGGVPIAESIVQPPSRDAVRSLRVVVGVLTVGAEECTCRGNHRQRLRASASNRDSPEHALTPSQTTFAVARESLRLQQRRQGSGSEPAR